jgi:hypothetical protein
MANIYIFFLRRVSGIVVQVIVWSFENARFIYFRRVPLTNH